jgi:hypothetical protein
MDETTPEPRPEPAPRKPRRQGRKHDAPTDIYLDAFSRLARQQRAFVRALLAGADYQSAAQAARYRTPAAVVYLLGRTAIADAIQRLAPLLPDQVHARRLLEPFALAALAGNLRGDTPHATRTAAAREIANPASLLDSRADSRKGSTGGASSQGGAGGPSADWARRLAERDARRKQAREPLALASWSTAQPASPDRSEGEPTGDV